MKDLPQKSKLELSKCPNALDVKLRDTVNPVSINDHQWAYTIHLFSKELLPPKNRLSIEVCRNWAKKLYENPYYGILELRDLKEAFERYSRDVDRNLVYGDLSLQMVKDMLNKQRKFCMKREIEEEKEKNKELQKLNQGIAQQSQPINLVWEKVKAQKGRKFFYGRTKELYLYLKENNIIEHNPSKEEKEELLKAFRKDLRLSQGVRIDLELMKKNKAMMRSFYMEVMDREIRKYFRGKQQKIKL